MKTTWIHGLAASLALASLSGGAAQAAPAEHPIACQLAALSASDRVSHDQLMVALTENVREVKELPNGYAFRLPTDAKKLAQVGEWISLERQCCPFFNFDLQWSADDSAPWLHITGTREVKAFLAQAKIVHRG